MSMIFYKQWWLSPLFFILSPLFLIPLFRYKSTTINSRSDHSRMLYQQNKRLELLDMRESIPRPLYRSKWTKRFQRFLKLCNQSGLFNQVNDAQTTMETIKAFQSQ